MTNEAPAISVMTLNIRRRLPRLASRPSRRWEHRLPLLERLIDSEQPHLIGLQEVQPGQSEDIRDRLGSRYDVIGAGRDVDSGGERCELLVDRNRLDVESWRAWSLSATPDALGSRAPWAVWPRIVVEAHLHDRVTGARLSVFVTHFDPLLEASRRAAAVYLATRVAEIEGPAVVVGDFNSPARSGPHRLLTAGRLVDALDVARVRTDPEWGTFSNFRRPHRGGRRLDWILVDDGAVVERAGVLAPRWGGRAVSDHEPVLAALRWPTG